MKLTNERKADSLIIKDSMNIAGIISGIGLIVLFILLFG